MSEFTPIPRPDSLDEVNLIEVVNHLSLISSQLDAVRLKHSNSQLAADLLLIRDLVRDTRELFPTD